MLIGEDIRNVVAYLKRQHRAVEVRFYVEERSFAVYFYVKSWLLPMPQREIEWIKGLKPGPAIWEIHNWWLLGKRKTIFNRNNWWYTPVQVSYWWSLFRSKRKWRYCPGTKA